MRAFIIGLVVCAVLTGTGAALFNTVSESVVQQNQTNSTHVRLDAS